MKYLLPILALLAFPALSNDSVQALFDAWKAKHSNEIQESCQPASRKCRVGGVAGNPERSDPPYLSWKTIRARMVTHDMFVRNCGDLKREFPALWKEFADHKAFPRRDLEEWSIENVRATGDRDISCIMDGPPPEGFVAPAVNEQGLAVNHDGSLSTGGNDWVRFFWIPLALGLVVGAYIASNGGSPTWGFLGTVVLYAVLTDPKAVLVSFAAVWVFALMGAWFAFGVILSGLGLKKGK